MAFSALSPNTIVSMKGVRLAAKVSQRLHGLRSLLKAALVSYQAWQRLQYRERGEGLQAEGCLSTLCSSSSSR
jgi:hypothetical protein